MLCCNSLVLKPCICMNLIHSLVKIDETMSHAVEGHPKWTVMVEISDKTSSTGGENGKPL